MQGINSSDLDDRGIVHNTTSAKQANNWCGSIRTYQQPFPPSSRQARLWIVNKELASDQTFELDQNGRRKFAINTPTKQFAISRRERSAAAVEVELVTTRLRPGSARTAAMHLKDARRRYSQTASRARPHTALEQPVQRNSPAFARQRMTV